MSNWYKCVTCDWADTDIEFFYYQGGDYYCSLHYKDSDTNVR